MECQTMDVRPSEFKVGGGIEDMDCCRGPLTSQVEGSKSKAPPAEFSDPSTIEAPSSLDELINRLHEIFSHDAICVEYVQKLMASYKGSPREWKSFAKFDKHRYTRNLVNEGNGKFNLMILCWNEAQGSSIHSHANSHCFLKVLDGAVKEELFYWPGEESETGADGGSYDDMQDGDDAGMRKWGEAQLAKHECGYINDSIGLHRVENPSHVDKAVTLHLYSPPFDECECFDERTGKHTTSKVTFWSKFGKRTPFGRHPNKPVQNPNQVENN